MAKRFLGSVGKAEAFRVVDGNLELAFVSKTLTDSGLNIQTTKEDIRGGQGAPIQFSFYHDPSVEITLTDILWKPEYLEAQLGANFNSGIHEGYITKTYTFDANGECTLGANDPEPKALKDLNCVEDTVLAWGAKKGSDDWQVINYASDSKTLTLTKNQGAGEYCVRYLADDSRAFVAEISTQIIPQELFLIITAPIFAGDACGGASKGKTAGSITFEVPRFQLNGAQEFQMNMSSNQTMSLSGIALASESADCDAVGGKLLRIIEVIDDRDWRDDVEHITSDEEYNVVGRTPVFYGINKDGTIQKIANKDLTFPEGSVTAAYAWTTAGDYTVSLKDKDGEVIDSTAVTVATE